MVDRRPTTLSSLEYHVLLALADGPLYGYAVLQAVTAQSRGSVTPRAGSLYRVFARLMTWHFVVETKSGKAVAEPHPGLERKYYALAPAGSQAVMAEARRLRHAADLADERFGVADGVE
ncbi:MAG: helix-turn-helix transcriptional regulator [Gemmatimonadetes bacterium]|nr:helix-turn-helix transcriptional regulator [Gemmatimonadota bacterium]